MTKTKREIKREVGEVLRGGVRKVMKREVSGKVERTMREFKRGQLRSGSGDLVSSRAQAIAIALSQARKAGEDVPLPRRRRRVGKR